MHVDVGATLLFAFRLLGAPLRDGLPQHVLDLPVDAAQLVCRPFLELLPELGRQTKQERLALFRHELSRTACRC